MSCRTPAQIVVALLLCAPAAAQSPPPSQPEVRTPEAAATAVSADPRAYFIPSAWKEKARVFIDPGPKGLDGGFVLSDLSVGPNIGAIFEGPKGKLVVRIVPALAAGSEVTWTGDNVAIRVEESTEGAAAALAHLERLMTARESGWGWLRRDPGAQEQQAAYKAARKAMVAARRLARIGKTEEATEAVLTAMKSAEGDTQARLMGARVLYEAGRRTLGKQYAQTALPTVRKGLNNATLDKALQIRTTIHVARAMALGESAREALALGLEVAGTPHGCEAVTIARDLVLINAMQEAITLGDAIVENAPTCDAAQAFRVDILRLIDQEGRAQTLATELIEQRTGLMATRSAWAHAALEAEDLETATLQASVPVERGGANGDSVIVLAAILGAGGAEHAPFPRWLNMLERQPTPANRGLGAATFFVRNEYAKALEQILAMEATMANPIGLKAMRAVLLARSNKLEEARAALSAAWEENEVGLWAVAGEAELAEAESRFADAVSAWGAYIRVRRRHLGPLTVAQAQERLEASGRGERTAWEPSNDGTGARATTTPGEKTPAGDEKDRIPTWVWFVLIVGGVLALYVWRRVTS